MASPPPSQPSSLPPPPPPPFDPLVPARPVSYPLTLPALAARSYFRSFHYPFNVASVPLPASATHLPPRRRLLVCHDMQGGYTDDDKWVQGGSDAGAYGIWHWHLMDVFVYFSHSVVTLPPPGWVNAAHTHGVKVLGTFLTEWDEGTAICNTLLSTKESSHMYAERLAELAAALGFDGWLINMEVKLDVGQIANLKEFVKHLTEIMHSVVPGSLVIWYDSVTKDGKLDWQDQLNEKNMPFFDLCDGIFVNYTWKESYPKISGAIAGKRRFDVYMGIDVFGRNTYGGGQWKTHVALDLLKKDNVSAAVFAPGWVYETKQEPDFETAQNRWWGLVQQSWGILQSYPKSLPFYSNFDQGHGFHFSIDGLEIAHDPWNNMSCQGFQPLVNSSTDPAQNTMQVFINFKGSSYSGGGKITCKGRLRQNDSFSSRIFHGKLPIEDRPLHITYSVKSEGSSLMGLSLEFSSKTNGQTLVLLSHDTPAFASIDELANKFAKVVSSRVKKANGAWVVYEANIAMCDNTLGDISIFCCMKNNDHNVLVTDDVPILEHGLSDYHASLGHISIQSAEQNAGYPPPQWAVEDAGDLDAVRYKYLGVARVQAFYVSDLEVPSGVTALRFVIQGQGYDGVCQELEQSPALLLEVRGSMWSFQRLMRHGILFKILKAIVNLCNNKKCIN